VVLEHNLVHLARKQNHGFESKMTAWKQAKLREKVNLEAKRKHTSGMHRPFIAIRLVQGHKAPDDRIIEINTGGTYRRISLPFLLKILNLLMINEDYLHPYPEKGRYLIVELITELANNFNEPEILDKLIRKYCGKEISQR